MEPSERDPLNQILPWIWLGAYPSDLNALSKLGIKVLINMMDNYERLRSKSLLQKLELETNCFPVMDVEEADILSLFPSVCDVFLKARTESKKVYIHCGSGKSRSCAALLSYMVQHEQFTLKAAFKYVQERRSVAMPNRGFWRQLQRWETTVCHLSESTVSDAEYRSYTLEGNLGVEMDEITQLLLQTNMDIKAATLLLRQQRHSSPE